MTVLPQHELRALGRRDDFRSIRIMELGNKKNSSGLYRDWYESQSASYFCIDTAGTDGAIQWDVRSPMPDYISETGPFDIVTNFGFTEHICTNQLSCWENIHNMVHPAYGQLSCVLPAPGSFTDSAAGRWYPHPAFFSQFARMNGYEIEDLWVTCDEADRQLACCRMHRLPASRAKDFFFSPEYMYDNFTETPFSKRLIW